MKLLYTGLEVVTKRAVEQTPHVQPLMSSHHQFRQIQYSIGFGLDRYAMGGRTRNIGPCLIPSRFPFDHLR